MAIVKCPECGSQLPNYLTQCPYCGATLVKAEEPAQPVVQEPEYQPQPEPAPQPQPQQIYQQVPPQQMYQQQQQQQQQQQPQQPLYQQQQPGGCPETHLAKAILITILCCPPLGIPAIVYAAGVQSAYINGQYDLARQKSETANKWCNAALICAAIGWVFYIFCVGAFIAEGL